MGHAGKGWHEGEETKKKEEWREEDEFLVEKRAGGEVKEVLNLTEYSKDLVSPAICKLNCKSQFGTIIQAAFIGICREGTWPIYLLRTGNPFR